MDKFMYLDESRHFTHIKALLESNLNNRDKHHKVKLDELINQITSMRSYSRMGMWYDAGQHAWQLITLVYVYTAQNVKVEPLNVYDDATKAVTGERNKNYGDAYDNFKNIADLEHRTTTTTNTRPITPEDVALNMMCVKVSRLMHTPDHYDSLVDLIGYALCLLQILQHREDAQLLPKQTDYHTKRTEKLPRADVIEEE